MKKLKIVIALMLAMAVCLPSLAAEDDVKKIAILETVDKADDVKYGVELSVRNSLTIAITMVDGYEALDRVNTAEVLGEHNFQRTGYVSDEQIRQLGIATGAAYILISEVAYLDEQTFLLTASIIDIQTAKVVKSAREQTATDATAISDGCKELAKKLLGMGKGHTVSNNSRRTGTSSGSNAEYIENVLNLNMKMLYVEGGTFTMGATSEQGSDAESDENPAHSVQLDSYYISATEVTQAQWQAVMGTNPSYFKGSNRPVENVSWHDAQAFCRELSNITGKTYLLPTEAQWEYAARGGNKSRQNKYSGSYAIDAVAWYTDNSGGATHDVGAKRPNELGIYDMSGNVWEWCSDWYGSYPSSSQINPTGPSSGSGRVLRGGSWYGNAGSCRVSDRSVSYPSSRFYNYGFRVVLVP